jgi:DNA polymerase-4
MPVLSLDLNAFFASVEQQERPELRDRPVGVVPVLADTSCCIAASYPAKAYGIKTGTAVAEARRLCPMIVLVEARPALYVQYHERIKSVVDRLAPITAVPSIDEFTCELPAGWQDYARAAELGRRIKRAILDEVGACLRCSVGIAPNAYLAKTACDLHKPDGLTVLRPEDLPDALLRLELRDLCGIGPNMERRLHAAGIHTVERLYAASKLELRRVWGGIGGERMYDYLRGLASYEPPGARRSVGHSHVLPPELRSDGGAHAVIHRMLQKAAMRLRRLALAAGGMQIAIRYLGQARRGWDGRGWHAEGRFVQTDDTLALTHHLETLWARRPAAARKARPVQVGVVLFDLVESGRQTLPLFPSDQPHARLLETVDRINLRFGKNTLYFGAAHAARDRSPTRIAFTRIPDIAVE